MPKWDRAQWRAAEDVVKSLLAQRTESVLTKLPDPRIDELRRLRQRWQQAVARGWHVAAATLMTTWDVRLRWLITDLEACRPFPPASGPLVPTAAQVYRDLDALRDEFEFVDIDMQAQTVTVRTDRIILDEFDLGPFTIVWKWSQPEDALRVIAQEPQRADHPEDVTHPHVRDDELCVGDAAPALDQAFRSGRLFDAFLILRQVLKTYNPGSAYASLARWTGQTCHGCASRMSDDDSCSCATCGEDYCGDCAQCCDACGDTVCEFCLLTCPECEAHVCHCCRALVDGRRIRLCQTCHEAPDSAEETPDDADETPLPPDENTSPSAADVPSDRVGEAALPAGCG